MNETKPKRRHKRPKTPPGYLPSEFYFYKYNLRARELKVARAHGLKHLRVGNYYFYKEKELNDFYAGKYGTPYRSKDGCDGGDSV